MRLQKLTQAAVPAGAALQLQAQHYGRTILLDTLAGSVVTLPKSVGNGAKFLFRVSVLATSVSHKIQVQNGIDVMRGIIACLDSDLGTVNNFAFAAVAASDTITLDRTNTGSVTLGEWVEVEDVQAGFWHVRGQLSGAAPATPFSAAVN